MLRLTKVLMAGAAVMALAACGSAEVASPGEGDFGTSTPTTPTTPTTPITPTPGTPAADCPTGLSNIGLVAGGTLRACQLPSVITGNLSLAVRAGTIYAIAGATQVGVDRGIDGTGGTQGILTIDPGVRIFASGGGDALVVNRGSQIFAEGTATNPIIFTSRQNVEGTTTNTSQGQWGGIIIAGRAPQANCQLTAPVACTGTVEGGLSVFYGGNTAADNSGRLRYIQIKYSGFQVSPGNELQGLTLAGTGSGTTISHIQVYNSSDDGIEIFGGNANLSYLVINGADDDGLDTDTGWRGGAQFGIITQRATPETGGGRGFEWSAAPTPTPYATRYLSQPKVSNFTIVGRNAAVAADAVIRLDSGTDATILNSVFTNPTTSVSACLDINSADTITSTPTFSSVSFACSTPFATAAVAGTAAAFGTGTNNNNSTATSTLTAPTTGVTITNQSLNFINGANETAVTATNANAVYAFFVQTNYIGAVRNATDTWYQGWTCGLTSGLTC